MGGDPCSYTSTSSAPFFFFFFFFFITHNSKPQKLSAGSFFFLKDSKGIVLDVSIPEGVIKWEEVRVHTYLQVTSTSNPPPSFCVCV